MMILRGGVKKKISRTKLVKIVEDGLDKLNLIKENATVVPQMHVIKGLLRTF